MLIASESLWYAQTNTYVIAPEAGRPAIIVDAPPDPEAILELVARYDLTPTALLLTHGHIDHTGGAGTVVDRTGAMAYVHPDDDYLTLNPLEQLRALFGMTPEGDFAPPRQFEPLVDGESLRLAGLDIEVLHTPGHTPGHCCFLLQNSLFSGDHLFAGSIGRTDLPGGDMEALLESMRAKILPLADETTVYPGHGPSTTIAAERRSNPFLQGLS